jgi:hypothetical protein
MGYTQLTSTFDFGRGLANRRISEMFLPLFCILPGESFGYARSDLSELRRGTEMHQPEHAGA